MFNAEYPMVRWLEANGYDVSYFTGVDSRPPRGRDPRAQGVPVGRPRRVLVGRPARQRRGGARRRRAPRLLQRQRGLLEDALGERASTARARHRTLVSYKETHANAKIDPLRRGPGPGATRAFQPRGTGTPENALTGTIFTVNCCTYGDRGAGRRRQDALLAEHERRHARRRPDGDARRRHARLRVGRGPRQRLPPAGSSACRPPPSTSPSESRTTARPTARAPRPTA